MCVSICFCCSVLCSEFSFVVYIFEVMVLWLKVGVVVSMLVIWYCCFSVCRFVVVGIFSVVFNLLVVFIVVWMVVVSGVLVVIIFFVWVCSIGLCVMFCYICVCGFFICGSIV